MCYMSSASVNGVCSVDRWSECTDKASSGVCSVDRWSECIDKASSSVLMVCVLLTDGLSALTKLVVQC